MSECRPGPRFTYYRVASAWEALYPQVIGVVAAGAWIAAGADLVLFCKAHDWHLDQMYTALFGFLAITTGYLTSFYGTIQTASEGFIRRIRSTRTMGRFLKYIKVGIVVGFYSSLTCVPMMIASPLPTVRYSIANFAVSLWFGLTVCAVLAFYRVARNLFALFEAQLPPDQDAG